MKEVEARKALQVKIEQAINHYQLEHPDFEVVGIQVQKIQGSFNTLIMVKPKNETITNPA